MEIQKIFSDEYNEERLYSVLMDEDELMMFSEIQKEFAFNLKKIRQSVGILTDREKASKVLKNIKNQNNSAFAKEVKSGNLFKKASERARNARHDAGIKMVKERFNISH